MSASIIFPYQLYQAEAGDRHDWAGLFLSIDVETRMWRKLTPLRSISAVMGFSSRKTGDALKALANDLDNWPHFESVMVQIYRLRKKIPTISVDLKACHPDDDLGESLMLWFKSSGIMEDKLRSTVEFWRKMDEFHAVVDKERESIRLITDAVVAWLKENEQKSRPARTFTRSSVIEVYQKLPRKLAAGLFKRLGITMTLENGAYRYSGPEHTTVQLFEPKEKRMEQAVLFEEDTADRAGQAKQEQTEGLLKRIEVLEAQVRELSAFNRACSI